MCIGIREERFTERGRASPRKKSARLHAMAYSWCHTYLRTKSLQPSHVNFTAFPLLLSGCSAMPWQSAGE